jgi:DNA-binding beta-propeller fold protein YncE
MLIALILTVANPLAAGKKKKEQAAPKPTPNILDILDYSKIVWPNPPAITRIKYLNYFSAEKLQAAAQQKPKVSWMDRLSGVATGETKADKPRFQLVLPYGLAVDSKDRLYVADSKVLAVFVFDTQTKEVELIKNGTHARFGWITGLTIDDSDRLYVADSKMKRVLVFDPQHKVEGSISEGMVSPGGLAIDTENRFLYVADPELDQVLVYDADPPYKLLRRIGTTGKEHTLTNPGDFGKPSNVAVDRGGNLFVSDTLNDRVQVFDGEGHFVRAFGKAGDGPGYFARPKGIAIDGDGHVWVADAMQNRVQVFTPEGKLLIWMGGTGKLPGQFRALTGLAIDKKNRVFTSEQYPGRVQMFQYISDAEAIADRDRRVADGEKKDSGAPAKDSGAEKAQPPSGL